MFETRFNVMPSTFLVVGCGGTGSRLIPLLAQFIKTCAWVVDPIIFLIDDDVVEEKNLQRQNFISSDVGKNKAEVLATRYSRAYNINMVPIKQRVVEHDYSLYSSLFTNSRYSTEDRISVFKGNERATMIISCVDSMAARRAILAQFYQVWKLGGIFIDGGNEDIFGQVMFGNPSSWLYDNKLANYFSVPHMERTHLNSPKPFLTHSPYSVSLPYVPFDAPFYLYTQDQEGTRSCADLDQTMAINSIIATTMFGIIQNIMYSKTFKYNKLNVSLAGITPEYTTLSRMWDMCISDRQYEWIRQSRGIPSDKDAQYLFLCEKYGIKDINQFMKMTSLKPVLDAANFLDFHDRLDYALFNLFSAEEAKREREIAKQKAEQKKKEEELFRKKAEEEAKKEAKRVKENGGIKVIPDPILSPDGVPATPIPL